MTSDCAVHLTLLLTEDVRVTVHRNLLMPEARLVTSVELELGLVMPVVVPSGRVHWPTAAGV